MKFCMKIYLILCLFLFVSCSGLQSGRYVKFNSKISADQLAQIFNIKAWEIKSANSDREFFPPHSRIFIPEKKGMISVKARSPASIGYGRSIDSDTFLWPVPKIKLISSDFGRRSSGNHYGIDIPGPIGTPIIAVASGRVVYTGNEYSGFGNLTVIEHDDGFFTLYAHSYKNLTSHGQLISKGQTIALLGNSGRSSGPHLHFEIRRDGEPVDPDEIYRYR